MTKETQECGHCHGNDACDTDRQRQPCRYAPDRRRKEMSRTVLSYRRRRVGDRWGHKRNWSDKTVSPLGQSLNKARIFRRVSQGIPNLIDCRSEAVLEVNYGVISP